MRRQWQRCGRRVWWADTAAGAAIASLRCRAIAVPCMKNHTSKLASAVVQAQRAAIKSIAKAAQPSVPAQAATGRAASAPHVLCASSPWPERPSPHQPRDCTLEAIVQASISRILGNAQTGQPHQRHAGFHGRFIPAHFPSILPCEPTGKRVAGLFFKRCIVTAPMYQPGFAVYIELEFIYENTKIFFYRNNFRCFILSLQHDKRRTIRQGGAKTNNKRATHFSKA